MRNQPYDVVGVTFEGRQEILDKFFKNTYKIGGSYAVRLVREPDNKYDPNAVKVLAEGKHIGFLPRGSWVSKEMDKGKSFKACISMITGGGDGMSYGVNVDFEIV